MKKLLLPLFMLFMLNAYATIEDDGTNVQPSEAEVSKNRACFEELSKNGCTDPGEDHKQFRSCLHDSFANLSKDCQKMMTGLYGKKK